MGGEDGASYNLLRLAAYADASAAIGVSDAMGRTFLSPSLTPCGPVCLEAMQGTRVPILVLRLRVFTNDPITNRTWHLLDTA